MVKAEKWLGVYLLFTAALTGALVMVVELAGARIIAPFFGVGIFVWTALISVTLLSLSAGYWFGGKLADRRPQAETLFILIGLAGAWLLLIPWIRQPVLYFSVPLGLRLGAVVSASLLFGPALLLLGCVSPYVVRLGSSALEKLGSTVGLFYAVSTAGSFLGSMLTGFYLLTYLGVGKAITFSGVGLLALSAIYFWLAGRRPAASALAAFLFLPLLLSPARPVEAKLADGTIARIVDHQDSFYGDVKVIDYRYGAKAIRELTIDGLVQGGIDLNNGQPIYEYFVLMQHLPQHLRPELQSALVIGLGAGVLPQSYARQGLQTEAVDLDQKVYDLAIKHFDLSPSIKVYVEDARAFLMRPGKRYDLIVLDVFTGDTTPEHLLSMEAIRTLKSRLTPGGIVAFNLIGSLNAPDAALPSIIRTVKEAFGNALLYPLFEPREQVGNLILVVSDADLTPPDPATFPRNLSPMAAAGALAALHRPQLIGNQYANAPLLTDDANHLATSDLAVRESIRRTIIETTPFELLVSSN